MYKKEKSIIEEKIFYKENNMFKKTFLRMAAFGLLFAAGSGSLFAQVTVSGGFALSSMSAEVGSYSIDGDVGVGGNVYVDYLLPVGVPVSLGAEIGVDTATVKQGGYEITGTAIPLLLRAAYHFDIASNLDLYVVGKVGYVLGSANSGDTSESGYNGIGFGFDAGVAYYFTSLFGVFGEAGFDRYNLEKEVGGTKIKVPFSRFVTFGISLKF
jgi:hypothetical protein